MNNNLTIQIHLNQDVEEIDENIFRLIDGLNGIFKNEDIFRYESYYYDESESFLNIFLTVKNIESFWNISKPFLAQKVFAGNLKILESSIIVYHYDDGTYSLVSHFDQSEETDF